MPDLHTSLNFPKKASISSAWTIVANLIFPARLSREEVPLLRRIRIADEGVSLASEEDVDVDVVGGGGTGGY